MVKDEDLVVHFYISPECEMGCRFCYAMEHASPGPALDERQVRRLIGCCRSIGARTMVFCGGDPFRRPDLPAILAAAKEQGLTTRVDSNALRMSRTTFATAAPHIDWLALPIDGPSAEVHDHHRLWPGHFDVIWNVIAFVRASFPSVSLKVQTLVTKENLPHLGKMPPLIGRLQPDIWSIYTYFRAGVGRSNYQDYELSATELIEVQRFRPKGLRCRVDLVSSESHKGAYLFVSADGRVYRQPRLPGEGYVVFGDFREGAFDTALAELDIDANLHRANVLRR